MDASPTTTAAHRPGRGRVFDSIVEAVGDTPIVRLRNLPKQHRVDATILAKLEYFNPAASVKDRIGYAMIEAAEREGVTEDYLTVLPSASVPRGARYTGHLTDAGGHRLFAVPLIPTP